jgi:hypothetical protein
MKQEKDGEDDMKVKGNHANMMIVERLTFEEDKVEGD